MFSFVDIRLALLLSAAVLLARGQGEDDSKYHFSELLSLSLFLGPSGCWRAPQRMLELNVLCAGMPDSRARGHCDERCERWRDGKMGIIGVL